MREDITVLAMGVISTVTGIALIYFVNRRRFNRRTMFGTEGFNSYEKALVTTFAEKLGKLIGWLLLLFGLLLFFLLWFNNRAAQKHQKENKISFAFSLYRLKPTATLYAKGSSPLAVQPHAENAFTFKIQVNHFPQEAVSFVDIAATSSPATSASL